MLMLLAEWLTDSFYTGFNVFQYLTFRGILGVLTALLISLIVGPTMIRRLSRYQIGQQIREDGPKSHFSKAGTPTMGGALILVAITIATLLWADLRNRYGLTRQRAFRLARKAAGRKGYQFFPKVLDHVRPSGFPSLLIRITESRDTSRMGNMRSCLPSRPSIASNMICTALLPFSAMS